jgi:predicted aspartyl protease
MNKRVYSYAYDETSDPAMPVVEVGLSLLQQTEAETHLTALIDSGSDVTLMPLDALESLGAKPIDKVRIRGILGYSQQASLYLICLYIGPHRLPGIQVAALTAPDDCLVGRNVLNRLEITLNGPANVTEITA